MNGILFDIKRFAVHDGPGIRTTVFLKGCPLRCLWCHNPESQGESCITAERKIVLDGKEMEIEENVGFSISVEDLVAKLLEDRIFWEESGGGVTFSGGEPLVQSEFVKEAAVRLKDAGVHVAVDTSGYAPFDVLERLIPFTDLFLYDLKVLDVAIHRVATGVEPGLILKNLDRLLSRGAKVRIRVPVIPNINDMAWHMQILLFKLELLSGKIDGVDLLPYHATAQHKYERLKMENSMKGQQAVNKDDLVYLQHQILRLGIETTIGGEN